MAKKATRREILQPEIDRIVAKDIYGSLGTVTKEFYLETLKRTVQYLKQEETEGNTELEGLTNDQVATAVINFFTKQEFYIHFSGLAVIRNENKLTISTTVTLVNY